jgi:hypothetical protein
MKHHFLLGSILILTTLMVGCFTRPVPSNAEYIRRYLAPFSETAIGDLRFSYHGAVGGEGSIARFRIDDTGIAALKSSGLQLTQYDPDESDIGELKRRFAMCSRWGTIPSWFDFPFERSLDMYSEEGDYTATTSMFSNEYYIDTEKYVVYFLMIRG